MEEEAAPVAKPKEVRRVPLWHWGCVPLKQNTDVPMWVAKSSMDLSCLYPLSHNHLSSKGAKGFGAFGTRDNSME